MNFIRSNRSSRAQSIESIPESIEQETYDEVTERNINPELFINENKLEDLIKKSNEECNNAVQLTKINPLGNLLLQMGHNMNNLIERTKSKETPLDLNDLCKAFADNIKLEKESFDKKLSQTTDLIKEDMLQRDLNYHKLNPTIEVPDFFSPTKTLTTPHKALEAIKMFPSSRSKFSGIQHNGPSIQEFLFTINAAQSKLKLSQEEFKERLLASCTLQAHKFVTNLIAEQDTVSSIYHKLVILFDRTLSPETAKSLLYTFKAKRSDTLMKCQARIMELQSLAIKNCPKGEPRKIINATESCAALIRCLPPQGSSLCNSQYHVLCARRGFPTFLEFILFLDPHKEFLDSIIKQFGVPDYKDHTNKKDFSSSFYNQQTPSSFYAPNKHDSKYRLNTYSINSSINRKHYNNDNYVSTNRSQRKMSVNYINNRPPINRYDKYCSLCGTTGSHTAADSCFKMRDKSGRVRLVSPVQEPCPICLKKTNKRLYHPVTFCFQKDGSNSSNFNSYKRQ